MSAQFLRHVWGCRWSSAATLVLDARNGGDWYSKPTTSRLRERTAALIRERWYGRVITATSIIGSSVAAVAATVAVAIFKATT